MPGRWEWDVVVQAKGVTLFVSSVELKFIPFGFKAKVLSQQEHKSLLSFTHHSVHLLRS
jgi:hypothetical protein